MAFNSPGYIFMATHLAMSLKKYADISVQLICDEMIGYLPEAYKCYFDEITMIEKSDLYVSGSFEPGLAKLNAYKYSIYDETIYLDVDALCFKSIMPVFDLCTSFYHTEVTGAGKVDEVINYSWWATNPEIWKYFELTDESIYPACQSSFQYFKKSPEAESLHKSFIEQFHFPKDKLKNGWGGAVPDELIISGCCAKIDYNPKIEEKVVFFGHAANRLPLTEVEEKFYILSLYGNGKGNTLVGKKYFDWYDRLVMKQFRTSDTKLRRIKKAHQLMKSKHVG